MTTTTAQDVANFLNSDHAVKNGWSNGDAVAHGAKVFFSYTGMGGRLYASHVLVYADGSLLDSVSDDVFGSFQAYKDDLNQYVD